MWSFSWLRHWLRRWCYGERDDAGVKDVCSMMTLGSWRWCCFDGGLLVVIIIIIIMPWCWPMIKTISIAMRTAEEIVVVGVFMASEVPNVCRFITRDAEATATTTIPHTRTSDLCSGESGRPSAQTSSSASGGPWSFSGNTCRSLGRRTRRCRPGCKAMTMMIRGIQKEWLYKIRSFHGCVTGYYDDIMANVTMPVSMMVVR